MAVLATVDATVSLESANVMWVTVVWTAPNLFAQIVRMVTVEMPPLACARLAGKVLLVQIRPATAIALKMEANAGMEIVCAPLDSLVSNVKPKLTSVPTSAPEMVSATSGQSLAIAKKATLDWTVLLLGAQAIAMRPTVNATEESASVLLVTLEMTAARKNALTIATATANAIPIHVPAIANLDGLVTTAV